MSQMKLIYKTLGQLHEKLLGENQQPEKVDAMIRQTMSG
jgi:hypothetical protein